MAAPWVARARSADLGKHRCYVENKLAQETPIRNNEEMREHLLRMAAHSGFFKPDDGYGPYHRVTTSPVTPNCESRSTDNADNESARPAVDQ